MLPNQSTGLTASVRVRIWYALLLLVGCVFVVRLFYLQIIRHDHYQTAAISGQLKEYEIPASRGVIEAHNGNQTIPIVLNEKLYTAFADPMHIDDPEETAKRLAEVLGGESLNYASLMKLETRYAILAKKLSKSQKEQLDSLKLKGIGTREAEYRTYPQGQLAAQVLGFVNEEGEGKYGIEQYFSNELRGTPGQLKAITDVRGVPLVSNKDNVVTEPEAGKRIVLTLDVSMQRQLEDILKSGLETAKSESGGAVIIDPKTGAVKAMANYPSYDPSKYFEVENPAAFNNSIVSNPLEVGSIMKPLTMAAGLDMGVIKADSQFYDPRSFNIDGEQVRNVEEDGGAGTKSMAQILQLSLNTGVSWILMQMGGGEINQKARTAWHGYMTDHYRLGKQTGIEQGYEGEGTIPSPTEGYGLNITYANTSFGQGMTATPLQMGAAISSVLNGGTYYQPRLLSKMIDHKGKVTDGAPKVLRENVVKPEVGRHIKSMMENAVEKNYRTYGVKLRPEFSIGGKTGTAQVPSPEGGYYADRYNGTFMGFVGGDDVEYVVVVRVNDPKIAGYAGSRAAGPIFARTADMLIDNFGVTPKSQ